MSAIYDFDIQREGDYQKIIYKATKHPAKAMLPMMVFCLIPAGFLVYLLGLTLDVGLWATAIVAIILGFLLFKGANSNRKGGEIKLDKHKIIVGDMEYKIEDISMIMVVNKEKEKSDRKVVVVNDYGNRKSPGAMELMEKNITEVNYKIMIRYGSKLKVIASNLGDTEAEVLKDKIIELSGFKSKTIYSN